MNNYHLTPLEQSIEDMYLRLKITTPDQLNIVDLATSLNVWIYFSSRTSKAIEIDGCYSLNIDSRLNDKEQYEDFLHELCHLLRHSGNQTAMPEMFSRKQEQEAHHFTLYAAIPYSMVKQLDLPDTDYEIAEVLTDVFGVTFHTAALRVDQIKRRRLQVVSDEISALQRESKRRKYDPSKWMPSTIKIMDQLEQQRRKKGLI